MPGDFHRRLREATAADHARLEVLSDIPARLKSRRKRTAVVAGFLRLHREVEAALEAWLEDVPGLEFADRRRSALIAVELATLGGTAHPDAPWPFVVGSRAEALGAFYVLEGSTLGGRVIRRELEAAGADFTGLGFLDVHGDRTGERWRAFLAVLAAHATDADAEADMIRGAQAAFRHAERRLSPQPAAA